MSDAARERGDGAHPEDVSLARRARACDARALDRLAERLACVPRFLAARNRRRGALLDDEELRDLVQEVLAEVWRKLDTYAGGGALESWAFRFCVHRYETALAKKLRRATVTVPGDEGGPLDRAVPFEPGESALEHVHLWLEEIGAPGADVLWMHYFEELSLAEIARKLKVPYPTVKTWNRRAVLALRELLERRGELP